MLEHPDITRCLKYGYPHEEEPVLFCGWCGADIYEGMDYYEIEDMHICPECVAGCRKTAEVEG